MQPFAFRKLFVFDKLREQHCWDPRSSAGLNAAVGCTQCLYQLHRPCSLVAGVLNTYKAVWR